MAHLLDSPTLDPATAPPLLSVVYATEIEGGNDGRTRSKWRRYRVRGPAEDALTLGDDRGSDDGSFRAISGGPLVQQGQGPLGLDRIG
jgi:hypothetical protein